MDSPYYLFELYLLLLPEPEDALLGSQELVLELLVLGSKGPKLNGRNTKDVVVWTLGTDALRVPRRVGLRNLVRVEASRRAG